MLTLGQKSKIQETRDKFLIELETMNRSKSVSLLLQGGSHKRASSTEAYLFDYNIPVFTEEELTFNIDGKVLPKDGFRGEWLLSSRGGRVEKNRKIKFEISKNETKADLYKWKVKNDNSSENPRGEITDHRTRNDPESTQYTGNHYVECYAILNNTCIARARRTVIIS
jgi:hypothetical protein